MNLDDCIVGRRSIRSYKDDEITDQQVQELLESGVWAPSGMNAQPWKFVVIQDRDLINELSKKTKQIVSGMEWASNFKEMMESDKDVIFYDAPLLILVCIEKGNDMMRDVNLIDCGLLCQNMFLKSFEMGLGHCYIGFANVLNMDRETLAMAGVPDNHELVSPLIFGYPAENPKPKERNIEIIQWKK